MLKPLAALWAMGRCAPCVVIALAVALFSVAALAQAKPEGPPLAAIDLTKEERVGHVERALAFYAVNDGDLADTGMRIDLRGGPTSIRSQPR